MTDVKRCPHCQQRIPESRYIARPARVCRNCREPILVHHKWKVVTDGEASWFEHRHCNLPESYVGATP